MVPLVAAVTVLATFAGPASAGIPTMGARLEGAKERPGPGDDNGSGRASITLDGPNVCWEIQVRRITVPATAAHIHEGRPDVAGPVVITLSPPGADGASQGCTKAPKDLVQAIINRPGRFYVNVHNSDFPGGAVRGQLTRPPA